MRMCNPSARERWELLPIPNRMQSLLLIPLVDVSIPAPSPPHYPHHQYPWVLLRGRSYPPTPIDYLCVKCMLIEKMECRRNCEVSASRKWYTVVYQAM